MGWAVNGHFDYLVEARAQHGFGMFYGHGALITTEAWLATGDFPEIVTEDVAWSARIRVVGWCGVYLGKADATARRSLAPPSEHGDITARQSLAPPNAAARQSLALPKTAARRSLAPPSEHGDITARQSLAPPNAAARQIALPKTAARRSLAPPSEQGDIPSRQDLGRSANRWGETLSRRALLTSGSLTESPPTLPADAACWEDFPPSYQQPRRRGEK